MNNQVLVLAGTVIIAVAALLGFVWALLKYQSVRKRFAAVIDIEKERDRVMKERDELAKTVTETRTRWEKEFSETIGELEQITQQLDQVKDQANLESFGVYQTQYDLETSDKYKDGLKTIRDEQKQKIRDKNAAVCPSDWTVDGSKAKGRQMTNRQLKLMLRAFNGECDAAIAKVRYNNVMALRQRIERSCEMINKLGKSNNCWITADYLTGC